MVVTGGRFAKPTWSSSVMGCVLLLLLYVQVLRKILWGKGWLLSLMMVLNICPYWKFVCSIMVIFGKKRRRKLSGVGGGTELPISHLLPVFEGRKLKNGIDNSVFSTIEVLWLPDAGSVSSAAWWVCGQPTLQSTGSWKQSISFGGNSKCSQRSWK